MKSEVEKRELQLKEMEIKYEKHQRAINPVIKLVWTKRNGYMYRYITPDDKEIYSPFKWELTEIARRYEMKERLKRMM
jgi:hypothetical protein